MARYKIGDNVITNLRSWKIGKIEKTGTRYVRLKFNNYISKDLYLTRKGMEHAMQVLETLGYAYSDLSGLADSKALDTEKEVIAVIDKTREYNGNIYYEASFINKMPTTGLEEEIPQDLLDELKTYDTAAYFKGSTSAPPSNQPQTSGLDAGGFTTDDIPF